MFEKKYLRDLIADNVGLRSSSLDWQGVKCQKCNDYKKRGAFIFKQDKIGYNCFNCGAKAEYSESAGDMSKNFRKILNSFGITDADIDGVVNSVFFNKKEKEVISVETLNQIDTKTPAIELPPGSFALGSETNIEYQQVIADYLIKRGVSITKYKFYCNTSPKFFSKVIIPFYRGGNLIFWQARDVTGGNSRYDNATVKRDAVMFNFDKLYVGDGPLYIVEGVFDAMSIDGVALIGSTITEAKLKLLTQTNRRLIFVIDKDKPGRKLAEAALEGGFDITFAPGDRTDDVNRCIKKYGKAWTCYQLHKNIPSSAVVAKSLIKMRCA